MNRRVVFLSAFAAVLMMSMAAMAQDRPGRGGPGGRGMGMGMNSAMLLRAEAVQKALGVTEDQVKKLTEVFEAGRPAGGTRPDFANMSEEERQKFRQDMEKRIAEQEKKIGEILDAKQVARLKQIRLQAAGAQAVAGEEVAKELGLTEEQTGKIRDALQELRDSARDAQPAQRGEMREKMNAKVMELLTDEQKAKFKEMLGEPFDVSQLRMGGPGGPGGGRRGGN